MRRLKIFPADMRDFGMLHLQSHAGRVGVKPHMMVVGKPAEQDDRTRRAWGPQSSPR